MKTRIISACVMLPLLIFVYFGGWFLWAMALAIGIIGVREFYRGFEAIGAKPSYHIAYAARSPFMVQTLWRLMTGT